MTFSEISLVTGGVITVTALITILYPAKLGFEPMFWIEFKFPLYQCMVGLFYA